MTKPSDGATINRGGASEPIREKRDREVDGIAGNASEEGGKPSPTARARGETSSADDPAAIDLDTVHDRAS